MKKYGKPFEDIVEFKQDFTVNNDLIADKLSEIDELAKKQPLRQYCKNCNTSLINAEIIFSRKGIQYLICEKCGQVNGEHEDTNDFCKFVYEDQENEYSIAYSSKDKKNYEDRSEKIYVPKAKFLIDSLQEDQSEPFKLTYCDIGAGSGYFINAMLKFGITKIFGYEVSQTQVNQSKAMIGDQIERCKINEIVSKIETTKADVVTAIGVLEHLQNPSDMLNAISHNCNIKYFYLSVPLFSLSTFLQLIFPDVMERQLAAGHTHLYTESSLKYLANKYNFEIVSEWWFGTDIMDLYRSISVMLKKQGCSESFLNEWSYYFTKIINPLQLVIDEKQLSSEVHILFKKHK